MKRNLFALCALLLFAHSILAQDTRLQQPASEFTYSTAVVSIDSRGEIGGDFTNGFFPNEQLDVVWIDEPSYGTVQYNSESQLVFYQPSADNVELLDEFTVYATDSEGTWNITRFFFDPTSKELVFSTAVSNAAYEGASLGHFGRTSFCSSAMPTMRDGFTQFWGGVKLVTGILETAGGVAVGVGTSWTGVGAVAGVGIAAHGVDTLQSGIRQLWSGEEVRTGTSYLGAGTAHHVFGVESDRSVVIGELFDAAIGIASGVGTISKGPLVVDKFGDVFRISANVRLVPAVGRGLDETIDISADVTKLIKSSGTTTAGVYSGRGGDELNQLFSQVPGGNAPNRGLAGAGGFWKTIDEVVDPSVVRQLTPNACGNACGEMLLRGRGIGQISQANIAATKGLVLSDAPSLAAALRKLHPEGKWLGDSLDVITNPRGTFGALNKNGSFIASIKSYGSNLHMVVVDGLDDAGRVIIRDPWGKGTRYLMDWDDFAKHWQSHNVWWGN